MRCLLTGKGMLTYSPSIVAAPVKVLEEAATPDMQVTFAPAASRAASSASSRRRRGVADAALVARLRRGEVELTRLHAGDQPELFV
jgi:hypothetical protein